MPSGVKVISRERHFRRVHLRDNFGDDSTSKKAEETSMGALWQDVKYSLRIMAKKPSFLIVALSALALGIGVNTAIFSVVDAVVLRALPYRDPGRLVWATNFVPSQGQNLLFADIYYGWRQRNHVFEGVAAYSPDAELTLTGAGDPVRLHGGKVSATFLPVLGITPALGRNFQADEDHPAGPKAVLLSDAVWRSHFAADRSVIGRVVALDGDPYTVAGVLPRDFEFLDNNPADVLVPFQLPESSFQVVQGRTMIMIESLDLVARLRPGVTPTAAASELNEINKGVAANLPRKIKWLGEGQPQVIFLHDHEVGNVRPALLLLFGAVGFVLLIVCANVANLQLARAAAREKEVAIRGALGADRWQVARLLLTESLMVALTGGALGLVFAAWTINLIRRFGPENIPHLSGSHLDIPVLLFTLAVSTLTGALFGFAPILAAFRVSINDTLKEGGARSGTGRGTRRSQKVLMVAEVALSLVLFVSAGLLVRSFLRLTAGQPGFDPHGVLTARVSLPLNVYQNIDQQRTFFQQLAERIKALPGVSAAGATAALRGATMMSSIQTEGHPETDITGTNIPVAQINMVSPGAFSALRIPLKEGRLLDERDGDGAPPSIVVNEAFVRRFFPHQDPIGQKVKTGIRAGVGPGRMGGGQNPPWIIVGVVGDTKQQGMASEVEPQIIVTLDQWPSFEMSLVLRTDLDPLSLVPAVRKQVAELDRNLPLYAVQTMDDILSADVASQRFNATALAAFAGLAVLLAAVGIYGVMAYAVGQRTHEIGVRLALGAEQGSVLRMVLGQGLRLALLGVVIGLAGAFAFTRVMRSLLFEIRPTDPVTFAVVTVAFLLVALTACWIPARRATRVDPVITLRYE
jgi:putative ABC transport system permease protein